MAINDDADRNVTSHPELVELSSNLLELFLINFKSHELYYVA